MGVRLRLMWASVIVFNSVNYNEMKRFCYIAILFFSVLGNIGCQKVDEPTNLTAIVVTTNPVQEIGLQTASVTGSVGISSFCSFLLSEQQNLEDAIELKAEPIDSIGTYQVELTQLTPGTTYYVAFCVTDGFQKVIGNVQNFKTLSYLSIREVMAFGWNESEPKPFTTSPLGSFLYTLTDTIPYPELINSSMKFEKEEWKLSVANGIPFEGTTKQLVAYFPYQSKAEDASQVYISANTDFLYGSDVLSEEDPIASLTLKHAMAKVVVELKKSSNSQLDFTIGTVSLRNNPTFVHRPIALAAYINCLTGECVREEPLEENAGLSVNGNSPLDVETPTIITFYVIPTSFSGGEVMLSVAAKDNATDTYTTLFNGNTWESGRQYVYPVTITPSGMQIGDVYVEDWQKNEGGTIVVKK